MKLIKSPELQEAQKELENVCNLNGRDLFWKEVIKYLKHQKLKTDYLEFGCASGRTAKKFAKYLKPGKKYYTFDSFEGLPEDWCENSPQGKFKCEIPVFENPNIRIVKGLYQDTLEKFLKKYKEKVQHVSFINMDSDLYSSTIYVLEHIKSLLKTNTTILFDDFCNNEVCLNNVYRAWKEFREKYNIRYEYLFKHKNCARVFVRIL